MALIRGTKPGPWRKHTKPLASRRKRSCPFVYRRLADGTIEIRLTQGQTTRIDAADLAIVRGYTWHAQWEPKTRSFRAATNMTKTQYLYLHNLLMFRGAPAKGVQINHKNLVTLDNRRENLREACRAESTRSGRKRRTYGSTPTKSRYKGVYQYETRGCWRVKIYVNGRSKHLGYFKNELDAARAYDKAAKAHFGAFARTNADLGLYDVAV